MPQLTPLQSGLLEELAQAALIYQTSHTREEIALLSELFAEALADEKDLPAIWRAFALHRKRSKRFPTPAHIIELLPECRKRSYCQALPEKPVTRQTPGIGALYSRAIKGDKEAKARLAELGRKVQQREKVAV